MLQLVEFGELHEVGKMKFIHDKLKKWRPELLVELSAVKATESSSPDRFMSECLPLGSGFEVDPGEEEKRWRWLESEQEEGRR